MRIRRGGPGDAEAVIALFDEAVAWMVARGQTGQWGSEPMSRNEKMVARVRSWARARRGTGRVCRGAAAAGGLLCGRPAPGRVLRGPGLRARRDLRRGRVGRSGLLDAPRPPARDARAVALVLGPVAGSQGGFLVAAHERVRDRDEGDRVGEQDGASEQQPLAED